jgi:DNA gyrase subunit B
VVEGNELRGFLLNLDEYFAMFQKVERRLREARVAEALADVRLELDHKQDFTEKARVQEISNRLKKLGLDPALVRDEEHSAWMVTYKDATGGERRVDAALATLPEYRRFRALARQIARFNAPPFTAIKGNTREKHAGLADLLTYIKSEGKKDASVQRYKGLGEMNASQLWDTTMNPETRTLLQVRLDDAVESEEIFSTLMGEDVEARRKFIEDNALDVKNLDV